MVQHWQTLSLHVLGSSRSFFFLMWEAVKVLPVTMDVQCQSTTQEGVCFSSVPAAKDSWCQNQGSPRCQEWIFLKCHKWVCVVSHQVKPPTATPAARSKCQSQFRLIQLASCERTWGSSGRLPEPWVTANHVGDLNEFLAPTFGLVQSQSSQPVEKWTNRCKILFHSVSLSFKYLYLYHLFA